MLPGRRHCNAAGGHVRHSAIRLQIHVFLRLESEKDTTQQGMVTLTGYSANPIPNTPHWHSWLPLSASCRPLPTCQRHLPSECGKGVRHAVNLGLPATVAMDQRQEGHLVSAKKEFCLRRAARARHPPARHPRCWTACTAQHEAASRALTDSLASLSIMAPPSSHAFRTCL